MAMDCSRGLSDGTMPVRLDPQSSTTDLHTRNNSMKSIAKVVRIRGAGEVDVLHIEETERPIPVATEVLVEVAAAGLNRADCLQRRGFYPAPKGVVPDVPGLEFSGVICALGPQASRWKLGDTVMGICAGGAMTTHLVVHEESLVRTPLGMDVSRAGAVPEVFFTAYDALCQGNWAQEKVALIHAIGSGVGTAALQLAKAKGMCVVGTSRSAEKLKRAEKLGLDHGIWVTDKRFAKELKEQCPGQGADVILDFVGAAYLGENLKSIATSGTLVVIGLLGGVKAELPLGLLLAKRATIIGTVLRSRSHAEKVALAESFCAEVLPGLDSGQLQPVIDREFSMAEIREAHTYMESNQSFGKVLMKW